LKKINYRKIGVLVLWIIALSGLLTSLAFVNKKERKVKISSLNISIQNPGENRFVDEEDIRNYFNERRDAILNSEMGNVDLHRLEKVLNAHPAVEKADMSVDVNGDMKIEVKQRTPLVRVINMDGESYYIDTRSMLMPLSDQYTARVLVVSGNIYESYSRRYTFSVKEIEANENLKEVSMLDEIYRMAEHIANDTVLSGLIHQVSVTAEKEFEMVPAVGDHVIKFGSATDMAEKFEKLKVFYKDGLSKTDNWNKYSVISLKYKNQVVCTKK